MNTAPGRCLALLLALAAVGAGPALAQSESAETTVAQGQALDLQGVDLRAFIQDVSRATGSTFILDPRVQGTVTLTSQERMDAPELLGVLLATLRANGLVAIPSGPDTYRVVPDEGAATQPGSAGSDGVGYATEVFTLRHVDARAAAESLKGLVGRGGVVAATPQGNGLLIADYADNLARLRALVAQLDQDRSDIRTIALRNSSAREIAGVVTRLVASPGGGEGGRAGTVSVIPVESSNTIMLRGDPAAVERIATVVVDLDQRASASGDVRVVRLQHANAEQLLPVLQQLVGQAPDANAVAGAVVDPNAADADAAPSLPGGRRAKLARFADANAIVIAADAETQRMLADVIAQLDTRRAQVLVEAIV
ncbi:MAG TPA: secretin N-terminal domain-containing protein, partial [Arenimonas sp.]|nr:secretin N-terminal domain-containing protein [Arenimonas sp.]